MIRGEKSLGAGVRKDIKSRNDTKAKNKQRIYKKRGIKELNKTQVTLETLCSKLKQIDEQAFADIHNDANQIWANDGHEASESKHYPANPELEIEVKQIFNTWLSCEATSIQVLKVLEFKEIHSASWFYLKDLVPNLVKRLNTVLNFPNRNNINRIANWIYNNQDTDSQICDCLEYICENVIYNFDGKRTKTETKLLKQALDACKWEHEQRIQIHEQHIKEFDLIKFDGPKYPLGWMENDKQITATMAKKGNRFFYDILNYLNDNKTMEKDSRKIIEARGWPEDAVCVTVNRKTICKEFGMDGRTLGRYLKAMVKAKIIKLLGRHDGSGGRGDNVYQFGRWQQNSPNHNPKPRPFLMNTKEFKTALRNFKLH